MILVVCGKLLGYFTSLSGTFFLHFQEGKIFERGIPRKNSQCNHAGHNQIWENIPEKSCSFHFLMVFQGNYPFRGLYPERSSRSFCQLIIINPRSAGIHAPFSFYSNTHQLQPYILILTWFPAFPFRNPRNQFHYQEKNTNLSRSGTSRQWYYQRRRNAIFPEGSYGTGNCSWKRRK